MESGSRGLGWDLGEGQSIVHRVEWRERGGHTASAGAAHGYDPVVPVDRDLTRLASTAAGDFDGIIERVLPRIRLEVSGPVPGEQLSDDELTRALAAVLREILEVLGGESAYATNGLDTVIQRRFDQGVPLLDLLRNYRIGAAAIWEQLSAFVRGDAAASTALLVATPRVFDVIDHFSLRANHIYRELMISGARRQEQIRATLLDTVFGGDAERGAVFWEAAATLDIPRRGRFVILDAVASSALAAATDWEHIVAALPGVESAWFRLGPRSQIGLVALQAKSGDVDQLARNVVTRISTTIGLSAPFTTLADCRKARAQAGIAAAATSAERPIVRYDRDVLDILMASAPDAAKTLVQATLGPVLALAPERAVVLIDSVRVWLDHQQSIAATASAMHCHRNTVNYRLRRFEEVSGRSLSDNTWLAQVYLAVNYVARTAPLTGTPD